MKKGNEIFFRRFETRNTFLGESFQGIMEKIIYTTGEINFRATARNRDTLGYYGMDETLDPDDYPEYQEELIDKLEIAIKSLQTKDYIPEGINLGISMAVDPSHKERKS